MTDLPPRLTEALADRYRLERKLGEGGMAVVYLAEDLKHERKVALKVLKPELAAVVGAERFLSEIRTTANLQHPNVLPLFDSGEAGGFLYYVMPFVEGESLRDRLDREKQLPVAEAVRMASEVADALQAAHDHGVIHRDIKPANILLSRGRPLVADFGIALAVSHAGGGRLTETGLSLGTPFYMSPEQASADREPNAASDVYSLGCVLYEMLVGEPPFPGSSAQAVLARVLTADVPVPREHRSTIPLHVDAVIRRAIERLPADRFPDAGAFASALADPGFRHGDPSAGAVGAGGARRGGPGRLVGSLVAAVLVLTAALTWSLFGPSRASDGPSFVARFDLTPELGALASTDGVDLDLSEDGQRVAFVREGEDGQTGLWVRALSELEAESIPGTEGGSNPVFSMDGARLAYVVGGSIVVRALPDGPPLTVATGEFPAWGDDGSLYYSADQIIYRLRPGARVPEAFTDSVGVSQIVPDPLPEGKGLLLTLRESTAPSSRIAVVGPEGGEPRVILNGTQARHLASGHVLYTTADGTLLAASFDLEALEPGPETAIASGVRVSGNSATQFAVSTSGSLVYRLRGGGRSAELVWFDPSGGFEPVDPSFEGGGGFLALSPDGASAVLTDGARAIVKDLVDLGRRPVSLEGGFFHPAWTPGGDSILIDDGTELRMRAADGTGQPVRLHSDPRGIVSPIASPVDGWIVYRTNVNLDGSGDIMAVRPGRDSVALPLVATSDVEMGQALSPDGRWLAYSAGSSVAENNVYVVPFPNVAEGRWQVSDEGGLVPIWSRDGKELFYGNGAELIAVQVRTDPAFQVLSSEVLIASEDIALGGLDATYDVSPDGRFLMRRFVGEAEPPRVILVQNVLGLVGEGER